MFHGSPNLAFLRLSVHPELPPPPPAFLGLSVQVILKVSVQNYQHVPKITIIHNKSDCKTTFHEAKLLAVASR